MKKKLCVLLLLGLCMLPISACENKDAFDNIDTYEKYLENSATVTAFYEQVCEDIKHLYIRMCEYSIDYAEKITASSKLNTDKYKDFDELYDCTYDDAGDDILDVAYGNDGPGWFEVRPNEYKLWADTRFDIFDIYEEWSDFCSDVYGFFSDMMSELWDDIERAEEKIMDFQKNIEKRLKTGPKKG